MREKLIELIASTEYGNSSLIGNNFQKGFIEKIADNLIANGVTVTTGISIECKYVDKDGIPQTISRMFRVQTNADRIRAMSDKELADWMARTQIANVAEALAIAGIPWDQADGLKDEVKKECFEWLKQPVKESED